MWSRLEVGQNCVTSGASFLSKGAPLRLQSILAKTSPYGPEARIPRTGETIAGAARRVRPRTSCVGARRSRFAGWMGLPCARLSHSYWRRPGMREIEITDQFAALWPLS